MKVNLKRHHQKETACHVKVSPLENIHSSVTSGIQTHARLWDATDLVGVNKAPGSSFLGHCWSTERSGFHCQCLLPSLHFPLVQQVQGKGASSKDKVQCLGLGHPKDYAQFHFLQY